MRSLSKLQGIHTVSRKNNLLMGLLFFLLVFDGVLVISYMGRSYQDTLIINELGRIRGSLQQYSKRELYSVPSPDLENRIEDLFSEAERLLEKKLRLSRNQEVKELLDRLNKEYFILKELIHEYRSAPTSGLSKKIFSQSEITWELSDSTVSEAQIFFEKMSRYLYLHIGGVILSISLVIYFLIRIKRVIRDKLEYEANFDNMTGALNKNTFQRELERRVEEGRRYGRKLSLLFLDLDKFKHINDKYGHKAGDDVLVRLGKLLRQNIRTTDIFGRIGGEEFVVLAPETDMEQAYQLAEKIRTAVYAADFKLKQNITLSIGVTEYQNDSAGSILKRADEALYKAKKQGRNCTLRG